MSEHVQGGSKAPHPRVHGESPDMDCARKLKLSFPKPFFFPMSSIQCILHFLNYKVPGWQDQKTNTSKKISQK